MRRFARATGKTAAKAALQKAWAGVSPAYLAEHLNEEPRRFFERLDMSEEMEPPLRWLLDCDQDDFERALDAIMDVRASRKAEGRR